MQGSSIAINGVDVIYGLAVALNRHRQLFCEPRAASPSRDPFGPWLDLHCHSDAALESASLSKTIWRFPAPRSAVCARNSGPSAACPRKLLLPLGAMCATQARPGLNSTPHSRGRRRPRREAIFCGPLMRKLTSFLRTRRAGPASPQRLAVYP